MWGAVKPHAAVHRFDCTPHREKKHSELIFNEKAQISTQGMKR